MRTILLTIFCFMVMVFMVTNVNAYTKVGRTKKDSKTNSPLRIYSEQKYNLGIHISGGALLGEIKDKLTDGGNFADLHVIGVGLSAAYHIKTKIALGINFNLLFKYVRQFESSTYVKNYSGYVLYKLRSMQKNIPYLHFEYGFSTMKETSVREFGKSPFFKVGVGYLYHGVSSNHSRMMLYYQKLMPNDTVKEYGIPFYHFDHNFPIVGFEFIYAFSF